MIFHGMSTVRGREHKKYHFILLSTNVSIYSFYLCCVFIFYSDVIFFNIHFLLV